LDLVAPIGVRVRCRLEVDQLGVRVPKIQASVGRCGHNLYVLLRHRLLPQSHGVEGVLSPEIAAVRDDHPVTQLNHRGARLRTRRAALHPAYANPHEREWRIAKVDHLIDLVAKLVEDFRREPDKGPYPVVAS